MKIIIILPFVFLLSCNLFEPCCLEIINKSNYDINADIDSANIDEIILEKGKGTIVYISPGEIKINIKVNELNFNKYYTFNIKYLEKKKFEFSLDI